MRNGLIQDIKQVVSDELVAANKTFGSFVSAHEGSAVIREELDELQVEVKMLEEHFTWLWARVKNSGDASTLCKELEETAIKAACEAVQVAAMARKFMGERT